MNVRPDQLPASIAKKVYPVYMVAGDEPLQQMESLDLIRSYLRQNDFSEREVLDVDAHFDWQRLLQEAANLSLFASRRMLELRLPSAKPGRQGAEVLQQYLSQPAPDTVLIINAGKIDANAKKSAWYKAVERSGLVVQCWPVPLEQLAGWLQLRFGRRDMKADAEVLAYLSQQVEGNLLAADQEIEKLYLLLGPGSISYADVVESITSQSRYSVFELVDVLLGGKPKRAIRILAGLKAEGLAPLMLNSVVAKDIRLLTRAASATGAADSVLSRAGLWQSRIGLFKNCLTRHSPRAFQLMLKRCAHIDAASKGLIEANVWDEFEALCLRLAGSSRASSRH